MLIKVRKTQVLLQRPRWIQVTRVSIRLPRSLHRWSRSLHAPRDHRLPVKLQGATRLLVQ